VFIPMSGLVQGTKLPTYLDSFGNTTDQSVFDFTGLSFESGDLLVAVITADQNEDAVTQSVSGMTNLLGGLGGSNISIGVYWKISDGTETTISFSDSTRVSNAVYSFRNAQAGVADFTSLSADPPSITNNQQDTVLIVAAEKGEETAAPVPPSGYSLITSSLSTESGSVTLNVAIKERASANEDPAAFTSWPSDTKYSVATFSITGS